MDEFLTVAEVAELLKLNPQTIRNWIDNGQLPAVRVGQRRVRIKRTDLDRLIEEGYTGARSAGATETPEPVAEKTVRIIKHTSGPLNATIVEVREDADGNQRLVAVELHVEPPDHLGRTGQVEDITPR